MHDCLLYTSGIVSVPDERIVKLGELYHTKKVTPATIEFVDIAGLVTVSYTHLKKNAQYTNMSIRTMFHISKFYLILQAGIGLSLIHI